ncbi:MAG: EAL domain-containing protein [Sphingomonadales bacterium]|nr:EAL domain-containing protein [Sphingomonadales bacterium]
MEVRGIFRGRGQRDALGGGKARAPADAARRLELLDDFELAGNCWLWASDEDGQLTYISASAAARLGQVPEDLLGRPLSSLFETDRSNPDEKADRPLSFLLSANKRLAEVVVRPLFAGDGDASDAVAWWSITANPKHDSSGRFLGYRGSAKDVTIEYRRTCENSRAAEYDALTGLANRHRMNRRLDSMLTAFKAAGRACAVFLLDLDRFKHVNDTMGHPAGDELLRQVSRRIQQVTGQRNEVGRLGGDEFQVLLPDLDDRARLGELAGKIIQLVSQPYTIDGKRAVIGTSIGVAVAPYDGLTREDIIRNADLALYAAKNGGRGQFRFFSADLRDEAEERRRLLEDLRAALAQDQLALHYQPVVRVADNTVTGFEALMRWDHPERGPISPGTFIPIAEESNLINELGHWALRRACRDAAQWPLSVNVAVNVSAVQFANPDFTQTVIDALGDSGLAPHRLELELTESVFLGDSEATSLSLATLKSAGVRLALDDFGTGYSSLSYLRSAPFDRIKVDRTFVDTCTLEDNNSTKIIAAIIGLSEALGMEVTVEGVEAFDQLEVVCAQGARFIQGFIYARPMTLDAITERMSTGEFRIEPAGPDRHRPERRTVFLRVGVIHEDHYYEAVMRDLSRTGARVEGLLGVTSGDELLLDLGGGQLVICTVIRAHEAVFAVEFDSPLVSDGAGGLCTRHRVSPYALAAAGMPLEALPPGKYPMAARTAPTSRPRYMEVRVSDSAHARDFPDEAAA